MIARIETQGDVLAISMIDPVYHRAPKGGVRGKIAGFSKAARRRMMELMNRLRTKGTRTTFLTLTFAGVPSWDNARKAFKRFSQRLRRKYPEMSAVWRLERQERGSIHYHLICFNLPFVPQAELQKVWTKCTEEELSIIHIKLLNSKKAVMSYVSKYIAKRDGVSDTPSLDDGAYSHAVQEIEGGRHWGWINKAKLPFADVYAFYAREGDALRYVWWAARAVSRGRAGKSPKRLVLFAQDCFAWFERLLEDCWEPQEPLYQEYEGSYSFMACLRSGTMYF